VNTPDDFPPIPARQFDYLDNVESAGWAPSDRNLDSSQVSGNRPPTSTVNGPGEPAGGAHAASLERRIAPRGRVLHAAWDRELRIAGLSACLRQPQCRE